MWTLVGKGDFARFGKTSSRPVRILNHDHAADTARSELEDISMRLLAGLLVLAVSGLPSNIPKTGVDHMRLGNFSVSRDTFNQSFPRPNNCIAFSRSTIRAINRA